MDKVKSYALTFRPRDGVTDDQLKTFVKYVKKVSEFYHVVTEKNMAERHIHAGLILKKAMKRSNVVTQLLRMFPELSIAEKSVFRQGIKIMYNEDFIRRYCDKDDDTVVIESHLPEAGCMESYFPPKPALRDPTEKKKCSLYYHELERLWHEYVPPHTELNTINARKFLSKMMYSERCLPVIRDDRSIVQIARHLVRWLARTEDDVIELAPFEKEESY